MSREETLRKKYESLTARLILTGTTITTMESCTAGLIASLLTDTEGASAVFPGAFVTYGNDAKIRQGVPREVIRHCGVYSEETARAMADVCRRTYHTDIGVGVTGTFGNADPHNADSVPCTVYVAVSYSGRTDSFVAEIPAQPSRQDYKLFVADLVADKLLEVVSAS